MNEFDAYYAGRNDFWNENGKRSKAEIGAEGWESYKRGYRHAAAEERLNVDGDWDE